ncbi:phospholipid carrier-dependent glycosyltransferase [Campylobacter insulaenigrae]|uniref:Phospholipid carrier-dependent glycosyltransferase n=1 Tax=Campylobacter insulaenigrae TaxID=260714 RepID=A0ABY3G5F0_9BACT|nr:phospholipid carrier-dependent glycosyltransferase [Campylobacter insulaenigrae]MCR6570521.1 phospholipid carrier-dependent glycosyltransferase [Campylobacter insulaenigrae]MCR6572062.1 phospholipid carrier-dependent glycosyltransferase [Campylobacter insulaenigrae]MCR6575532.1 phospholipid carrier-dependent glycosyltransferase [Campylobacter insulaenigrae]MCR6578088.1 phospholipid carrier-dependent glycosyltransferase [Campylobacter insulaenigrae]MCR6581062.1 phospholipid carrier-dependent
MKRYLLAFLLLDFCALLYGISTLSISYNEAKIFFYDHSLIAMISRLGTTIFGQNDYGLRIPFVLLHSFSCILLYLLALKCTKTSFDALMSVVLFILLPGSVASALLINESSIVIFFTLLILVLFEYKKNILFYVFLVFSLVIDGNFAILYLAFFFYGIHKRDKILIFSALVLFAIAMSIYGFDASGKPQGYFLDTIGIFAACFSPLIFLYFFYVIYKILLQKEKPLLWFVIATTFIFCLLFSLRQRLFLEDFLPFCVVCTPLLLRYLMSSYRSRLPQLRIKHNIFIECSLIFLVLFYLGLIFNHSFYYILKSPQKHFAYNYHIAKELAKVLKENNILEVQAKKDLALRLKFYGIQEGGRHLLYSDKPSNIVISLPKHSLYFKLK